MFEQGDSALPSEVARLIDQPQYCTDADIAVDKTLIRAMCAVVQNSNPVFWSSEVAESIVGKQVAPSSLLAAWGRPHLGIGRYWTIEMQYRNPSAQLVGIDIYNFFAYSKEQP